MKMSELIGRMQELAEKQGDPDPEVFSFVMLPGRTWDDATYEVSDGGGSHIYILSEPCSLQAPEAPPHDPDVIADKEFLDELKGMAKPEADKGGEQ